MTTGEKREWAKKGISIVKASSIKPGDRILVEGEGVPRQEVEVIVPLYFYDYVTFLHKLHPLGTSVKLDDEVMRLHKNVHWLGDFRKEAQS